MEHPRLHRGSCICENYELRITQRCLTSDLGVAESTTFSDWIAHPIVHAFVNQRSTNPIGTRTVGPAAGDKTIYRLGHGHDHRGATWHDDEDGVIWLCAYRLHRSGEADDAFPYFHQLIDADEMLPTEEDYNALFDDRGHRFADTIQQDAQQLLALAKAAPGVEQIGILGGEDKAGVIVEVVETLTETYVAMSGTTMTTERIVVILAAFDADASFGEWEWTDEFPTRQLRGDEICCRLLREH